MKHRIAVPFRGMPRAGWYRLGLFSLALLYLVYFGLHWTQLGIMDYLAIDFRVFRASAEIAVRDGFEYVYDSDYQEQAQRLLFAAHVRHPSAQTFETVPMPYLPAFILLFLPLLAASPGFGFGITVILNLTMLALYLYRFWRAVAPRRPIPGIVGLALLLSLPSVANAAFGQVNVWLTICLGEFLISSLRGRKMLAGAWLGGMLVKPQLIILLVPLAALAAEWMTLLGFAFASLLVMGSSIALAGTQGMTSLARLILSYPDNLPTTYPESMMNWRALGILLEPVLGRPWTLVVVVAGIIGTTILVLPLARRLKAARVEELMVATLGSLAGACIIAWHSHIHMALPMILPLAALNGRGLVSERRIVLGSVLLGASFSGLGLVYGAGIAHTIAGLMMFGFNFSLVILAAAARDRLSPDNPPA